MRLGKYLGNQDNIGIKLLKRIPLSFFFFLKQLEVKYSIQVDHMIILTASNLKRLKNCSFSQ